MNLDICEKNCGIVAIQFYSINNINLIDKYFANRTDLPCNKYIHVHKLRSGETQFIFELKIEFIYNEKIPTFPGNFSLFTKNNKETKCFRCNKECPYYSEHMIFDEN